MKNLQKLLAGLSLVATGVAVTILKNKGKTALAIGAGIIGSVATVALLYFSTFAAELTQTPTNIAANDAGYLDVGISASATSITVSPIDKWINGVKTEGCFDTGSGFVLIQDGAGRSEIASYGSKSCSSANVTTLSEVRRGLSPTSCSFTAGTGLSFSAGTSIRVVNHPCFFTQAVYKDVITYMEGVGALVGTSTTQPFIFYNDMTTAQRDALTYVGPSNTAMIISNSTLNTMQYSTDGGSSWYSFGSGSIISATTTVAGKVEVNAIADNFAQTGNGDSGSPVVVLTSTLTQTGGLAHIGKIPILSPDRGVVTTSLGGTGSGALSSSGILLTNGSGALKALYPTTEGHVVQVDSNGEFVSAVLSSGLAAKQVRTTSKTATGASYTSSMGLAKYVVDVSEETISAGDTWVAHFSAAAVLATGALNMEAHANSTVGASSADISTSPANIAGTVIYTLRSTGASGKMNIAMHFAGKNTDESIADSDEEITVDTTADFPLEIKGTFGTSNAGNSITVYSAGFHKISAP